MTDFIKIIDAVRRSAEDGTCRAQVTKITVMADGNYKADGLIARRNTMFFRTWIINRDTLAILEV
jgi:hypothetical protein